jgi:hypothetical protein
MKVLIKFKLLEWQSIDFGALAAWAQSMAYMKVVHERFGTGPLEEWLDQLIADLVAAGAARREAGIVYNI